MVLCRHKHSGWEILLLHAGGPFYAHRDDGAWTIPKGEVDPGETPQQAAWREFAEETGWPPPPMHRALPLPPFAVTPVKILHAWLAKGDADPTQLRSATFLWKGRAYPEADRAAWFPLEHSRAKLFRGQAPLVNYVQQVLATTVLLD